MKRKIWKTYAFTKQVWLEFWEASGMKFSAALSYYTVFAMAPVMIIIISISGMVFRKASLTGELYHQVESMVGSQAAIQIQDMVNNVHRSGQGMFATIVSGTVLLIAATGIFGEIQDSINKIWGLKSKPRKAWWKMILNRLISFSMIICVGFVLMISFLMNTLVTALSKYIQQYIQGSGVIFVLIMNQVLSFAITTFIFAMIFKMLPDAKITWRNVIKGALLTAVLFTLGQFGISYYVGSSNLGDVYGAAASIIIVMVWVYYSAIILYIGAAFTKVYARHYGGGKITPNRYAVWITTQEVEIKKMAIKTDTDESEKVKHLI